jgi:hypothetical protein
VLTNPEAQRNIKINSSTHISSDSKEEEAKETERGEKRRFYDLIMGNLLAV